MRCSFLFPNPLSLVSYPVLFVSGSVREREGQKRSKRQHQQSTNNQPLPLLTLATSMVHPIRPQHNRSLPKFICPSNKGLNPLGPPPLMHATSFEFPFNASSDLSGLATFLCRVFDPFCCVEVCMACIFSTCSPFCEPVKEVASRASRYRSPDWAGLNQRWDSSSSVAWAGILLSVEAMEID